MERKIMKRDAFIELLNTEEYRYKAPEKHYIREFEQLNRWTSDEALNLWDEHIERVGVPPTAEYYIEEGLRLTKEHWFRDSEKGRLAVYKWDSYWSSWNITYIPWKDEFEEGIRYRLSRMYESFMAEYSALAIIGKHYPFSQVFASHDMDLVLGVDMVVVEDDKVVYLHVTKNSEWAEQNLQSKSEKSIHMKNVSGKKCWWKRRWTESHEPLFYDLFESDTTESVNGHHIFREDYVQEVIDYKLTLDIDTYKCGTSELADFHRYLKENWIQEHGIASMFVEFD